MAPKWDPIKEVGLEAAEPYTTNLEKYQDLCTVRDQFGGLTSEDEQHKHVYAAAGRALYAAQCFETEIQLVILLVGKAKGALGPEQAYEEASSRLSTKTLGRLLKEVQQVVKFGDNGRALLSLAFDKRNSLVHGFFEHYSSEFPIRSGRKIMLADLLERTALFRDADAFAQIVRNKMMDHIGFTEKHFSEAWARNQADMDAKEKGRSATDGT